MALGLKADELGEEVGCSVAAIRKWTLDGMPYEPAGRLRFYDLEKVCAWLRARDDHQREQRRLRREAKAAA